MTAPQAEALIDLVAYRGNLQLLAARAPDAALLAVVKANAYGHGMLACARAAREAGAAWLGVATVDEALALRAAGDTGRILCWLNAPGANYREAIEAGIDITASSADQLTEIAAAAVGGRHPARVQLKIDTGLSRNGARGDQWFDLLGAALAARDSGRVHHTGTWSHLACADRPEDPANYGQQLAFEAALEALVDAGLEPGLRHLANSAATIALPESRFDLVRVGIASYGLPPSATMEVDLPLRPVMTLRGRLAAVKQVPSGAGVSYDWTYTTRRSTRLGLVPLGYGDGIPRHASGKLSAAIGGQRVPLVGKVAMDQVVVDLGELHAVPGDVVTLFGPGDDGEPTAEEWAAAADTIGYEVVTRIGGRVARTYRGER